MPNTSVADVAVDEDSIAHLDLEPHVARPPLLDAALFLYLPFLASVSRTFASSSDDPFITLRYAANLLHGYGPVFNPGQHVQGFTSPLHLVVAVLAYLVPGGDDLLKLKLASLLFGVLAIREAGILLYGIDIPRWARRTGALAVSTSWIVAFASGNGLETTLAMWLLLALTRRLVLNGPRRSPLVLALIAFAAVLARPDALLVLAGMAVVGLVIERPLALRQRVSWAVGALTAVVGTAVGGLLYFGDALPNTYYAKDMGLGQAIPAGAHYLVSALVPGGGAPGGAALLILQVALLCAGIRAVVTRFPRCGYLVAIVGAQALFILKSGGDWMNGARFAAPAVIPLILVELLGLVDVIAHLRRHSRRAVVRAAGIATAAGLVASSSISLYPLPAPAWHITGADDRSLIASGGYPESQTWSALPGYLQCVRSGQLVASSEVGYLGFSRQDLHILDVRGLTDRSIAKGSPASVKLPWGVDDPSMLQPTSAVGRVLARAHPVVIATFDPLTQASAFGGAYRLVKVPASWHTAVYVRTSQRWSCPG